MAKLHPYCLGGVIHCGKKKNIKEKQAEKNMIINLNNILKKINAVNKPPIPSDIKMFLETSSGMGSEICSKIGRLKSVYQTINNNRLKICVDTAHIFAAGYSMENYFKEFSKKIGLQEIGLIHLNDSKEPRGSNLDKHESIGYGFIFNKKLKGSMKSFKYVLKYIKKLVIPTVLETHSDCIYKKDYYHSLLVGNKDISYQKEIILILKELKLNKELKYIKNNPHKTGISVMSKKAQQKNEQIINMLKNVSDIEKAKGNRFKNIAYNKAIAILKSYPTEIKSGEELIKLDGIGKSIAAKITEFLNTGSLKYLVKKENKVSYEAIRDISSVEGIGPSLAKKLVEKEKIESIKDLQNAVKNGKIKLTHAQQIGLKYFSDLQKRIPRQEITKYDKLLKTLIETISPKLQIIIAGSYRRGMKDSGDIDVLVSFKKKEDEKEYNKNLKKIKKDKLDKLVQSRTKKKITKKEEQEQELNLSVMSLIVKGLKQIGVLQDTISFGIKKFMGYVKLNKKEPVRHIDIRHFKVEEYPSALLYFTGNAKLNVAMRKIAQSKNMKLNEYGLYKEIKSQKKDEKTKKENIKWKRIEVFSEKDIFDKLDMKYLKPEDRNT